MPTGPVTPPFDLDEAMKYLAGRDTRLRRLIESAPRFQLASEEVRSPYDALLRAIVYQSISGRAAATIFGRVKALAGDGRVPAPAELLKLRTPTLRKAGLSGAKVLAMKDLARKTLTVSIFLIGTGLTWKCLRAVGGRSFLLGGLLWCATAVGTVLLLV